jgi:hypothetical protein
MIEIEFSKKEIEFFNLFPKKLEEYALLIVFKDDLTDIGKLNLIDYESFFRENKEKYYKFINSKNVETLCDIFSIK